MEKRCLNCKWYLKEKIIDFGLDCGFCMYYPHNMIIQGSKIFNGERTAVSFYFRNITMDNLTCSKFEKGLNNEF